MQPRALAPASLVHVGPSPSAAAGGVRAFTLSAPLLARRPPPAGTITNSFSELHKPTIGVDFHFRKFEMNGASVALQLWDIAGQDRFGALYRIYYRDAFGAMLVFDLSRPETFQSVLKWKREIDSKVTLPNGSPLPVVLLANKCDLPDTRVEKETLDAFCKEHGFVAWYETSAKTNHNIEEAVVSDFQWRAGRRGWRYARRGTPARTRSGVLSRPPECGAELNAARPPAPAGSPPARPLSLQRQRSHARLPHPPPPTPTSLQKGLVSACLAHPDAYEAHRLKAQAAAAAPGTVSLAEPAKDEAAAGAKKGGCC